VREGREGKGIKQKQGRTGVSLVWRMGRQLRVVGRASAVTRTPKRMRIQKIESKEGREEGVITIIK
jgi:hypothetical protein